MTKVWIKMIIFTILLSAIIVLSGLYFESKSHIKTLKNQVKEQGIVIDSLLARKMTLFDVKLTVTDRSKSIIYGRYNKGTITMPQERFYKLLIDSSSVSIAGK